MNNRIATFVSHYDALTFYNFLKGMDIAAKLMPVPRKVSASCGTCVAFSSDSEIDFSAHKLAALYAETENGYVKQGGIFTGWGETAQ